ncbi:MAG: gamma-glutamylcyclotransferase [Lautropia sp.]|nr:gamma-glutamylcyclotransferase [Lautropia sp.]
MSAAVPSPAAAGLVAAAIPPVEPHPHHPSAFSVPPTPSEYLQLQWAFAYGSLIWNPEFEFEERHKVRIEGYHRAFCINSHTYRGTPESPGVVLGLDEGGSCEGIVYRVKAGDEARVMDRIYQREMLDEVYRPKVLDLCLADGRRIQVLTFIAYRGCSRSYLPGPRSEILRRLRESAGFRGSNREYALNTQAALHAWGIHDPALDSLLAEMDTV